MVDTPKDDSEKKETPKRRQTRKRSRCMGRGMQIHNKNTDATDNCATPDGAENEGKDDQASPGQPNGPMGMSGENPEGLEAGEDSHYLQESEDDVSLRPRTLLSLRIHSNKKDPAMAHCYRPEYEEETAIDSGRSKHTQRQVGRGPRSRARFRGTRRGAN